MITLRVNGAVHELDIDPATPLLWVLREQLRLTGTKFGCGIAQCGACTVHVDGAPVRACVTPARRVGDAEVTTIEAIASNGALHPVQQAWLDEQVPQCGYCQSGQIMTAVALLRETPVPDDADIDAALRGNVCRCGMYGRIRRAVHRAAAAHSAIATDDATEAAPARKDGGEAHGNGAHGRVEDVEGERR